MSEPHTIAMDSRGRLFVGDRENNRIEIFDQDGAYLDEWRQFGRPSGIYITKDDTIYVADSESGPDTGAHELMGIKKGIRIGSAVDGQVLSFIEDAESTTGPHSGAEGVGVDASGNVYGAVVRRQMLERHAGENSSPPKGWTEPFPPFRIADNFYYVGSKDLANYLITTPQGHILINSDLEANVPLIKASIEKLGFKFSDIKILLISQGHWDHDAGSATIKKLTGAQYMVMDADVSVVESGGKTDFHYRKDPSTFYMPAKVDRVLHDGDEIRLGGTVVTARLTPGHTQGCTTFTMKVQDAGKTLNAVIVGGTGVNPGFKLINNPTYPTIAQDYEQTFKVLKALPVDIFLGAHGAYFDMDTKYPKLMKGDKAALIDPVGYQKYVADAEKAFLTELAKQKGSR
jgi:metallo-beta-lactamase class B